MQHLGMQERQTAIGMLAIGQTILAVAQALHVPTSTLATSRQCHGPAKPKAEPHGTGLSLSGATDWASVELAHEHRTPATGSPAPMEPTAPSLPWSPGCRHPVQV